jgi:hypothetical protein
VNRMAAGLKFALGVIAIIFLFGSPLWILDNIFDASMMPMSNGSLVTRATLAACVLLVFDWMIHGFRLVWGGDRRPTWMLAMITAGSFMHRLGWPAAGWQRFLLGAAPFLFLLARDNRRYEGSWLWLKRRKKNNPPH